MIRRTKIWWALAAFTAINAAGALAAELMDGGMLHTGSHLVLTAVGAFLLWRGSGGRRAEGSSENAGLPGDDDSRLTHLEQSIDAVAIEVERIGEGQRFMARLVAEDNAAKPIENEAKAPPPNVRRD